MADSSTLSFRVDTDIIDRLDDAAGQGGTNRSALAREALLVGLQHLADGEGGIEVPEHLSHDAKVRQLIARNKKERRRGKFRSEFSKQLKRSFENNETPAEFRSSVSGYIEEAEDMGELPEGVQEEIDVDATTYSEWVEDMLSYYRVAWEAQTFDHDPIDDPLGNHEGIDNARQWVQRAENIASETDSGRRHELAQFAITDGVVPAHVKQQAEEHENGVLDGVVAAAEHVAEGRALTDSDTPELE